MARNKKYIPKHIFNPALQAKKIDKLSNHVAKLDKTIQALSKSHDNHIRYLGNFARHDVKNSIQSMDSVLSTNNAEEITEEHLESLKANLKVIRETMDNFSKLVPYSQDEKFSLNSLLNAVELINRNDFHSKNVDFRKDYDRNSDVRINLPFHSILQMLNNMIINSLKSIEEVGDPKIEIVVNLDEELKLEIMDNGEIIPVENESSVFEFGYSTTGGSGIGLFHAKYLCELFKGSIELENSPKDGYNKSFLIHLPIDSNIED